MAATNVGEVKEKLIFSHGGKVKKTLSPGCIYLVSVFSVTVWKPGLEMLNSCSGKKEDPR